MTATTLDLPSARIDNPTSRATILARLAKGHELVKKGRSTRWNASRSKLNRAALLGLIADGLVVFQPFAWSTASKVEGRFVAAEGR